jgi:hypothetical protein
MNDHLKQLNAIHNMQMLGKDKELKELLKAIAGAENQHVRDQAKELETLVFLTWRKLLELGKQRRQHVKDLESGTKHINDQLKQLHALHNMQTLGKEKELQDLRRGMENQHIRGEAKELQTIFFLMWRKLVDLCKQGRQHEQEMQKLRDTFSGKLSNEHEREERAKEEAQKKFQEAIHQVELAMRKWHAGERNGVLSGIMNIWHNYANRWASYRKHQAEMQSAFLQFIEGSQKGNVHIAFIYWQKFVEEMKNERRHNSALDKAKADYDQSIADEKARHQEAIEDVNKKNHACVEHALLSRQEAETKAVREQFFMWWKNYVHQSATKAKLRQSVHDALLTSVMGEEKAAIQLTFTNWASVTKSEKQQREADAQAGRIRDNYENYANEVETAHGQELQRALTEAQAEKQEEFQQLQVTVQEQSDEINQLKRASKEHVELKEVCEIYKAACSKQTQKIESLEKSIKEQSEEVLRLEELSAIKNQELETLQEVKQKSVEEIAGLLQTCQNLEASGIEKASMIESLESKLNDRLEEVQFLEVKVQGSRQELVDLKQACEDARVSNAEKVAEIESLQKTSERKSEEIARMEKESQAGSIEIDELKEACMRFEEANAERESLVKQLEQLKLEQSDEIVRLKQKDDSHVQKITALEESCSSFEAIHNLQMLEKEKELQELLKAVADMENQHVRDQAKESETTWRNLLKRQSWSTFL